MTQESSPESEITTILTNIAENFKTKRREEHSDIIENFFDIHREELRLGVIAHSLSAYNDSQKKAILDVYLEKYGKEEHQYKAEELIFNYRTVKRILSNLISSYEGGACSVDKTRVIMETAYQRFRGGETRELNSGGWNIPQHPDSWVELVDGLVMLLAGHDWGYFQSRKNLAEKYDLG